MIKALILDFDGTILDTETSDYEAWQIIFGKYNCNLPLELYSRCIGAGNLFDPYEELCNQSEVSHTSEEIHSLHSDIHNGLMESIEPAQRTLNLIENARLAGLQLAVASSGGQSWVKNWLKKLGIIDQFSTIRCAQDVTNIKPSPELFQLALSDMELSPSESIVFEDSQNGITAAKAAGIFCVAVPNTLTKQLNLRDYDLRFEPNEEVSFEELLVKATAYYQHLE